MTVSDPSYPEVEFIKEFQQNQSRNPWSSKISLFFQRMARADDVGTGPDHIESRRHRHPASRALQDAEQK
jgi:hypothetical protein